MNNSNWPTNIFDSLNDLKFVEMQLLNIGVALNTVGLDKLSEQLFNFRERLNKIREDLRTNISNHCSEDLKNAQQNSVNVLNAILAGKSLNSSNHDS